MAQVLTHSYASYACTVCANMNEWKVQFRLDFRRFLESGLRSPRGVSAGSIPEQRLVIEPRYNFARKFNCVYTSNVDYLFNEICILQTLFTAINFKDNLKIFSAPHPERRYHNRRHESRHSSAE